MAASAASATPSSIHRVAIAAVSGEAIEVVARIAPARRAARAGVRRDEIRDAQRRGEAFRQPGNMIDKFGSKSRKRRDRDFGQHPVSVVLDDRHAMAPRDSDDRSAARKRHRRRRRIMQRWRAVERFRFLRLANSVKGVGIDSLTVDSNLDEPDAQMRRKRAKPRVG